MTVRAVAVDHGSAVAPTAQPVGVNTRARARETPRSVTNGDRIGQRWGRPLRHVGRVMWLDAADSWIVRESSPAPRTVWRTDYSAAVPNAYEPFIRWCRLWRYPAVLFGAAFDGLKFLHIHPVRGPLTVAAETVIYLIATH